MEYTDADPAYSKVFDNEEFGYYSVEIQRPLRLRVDCSDEKLEALKNGAKDEALYDLLREYTKSIKEAVFLDYNAFMEQMETFANTASLKLTAKRKKAIRDYLTGTDEAAAPVLTSKGELVPDKTLKDTEQIPLMYDRGIQGFLNKEIKPYVPDAWINEETAILGYELTFTKYFYQPSTLRAPEEIVADIHDIEASTDGLLTSIVGGIM